MSHRIVGSIVLISLAIIFLPMVFQFNTGEESGGLNSAIPTMPRDVKTVMFRLGEEHQQRSQALEELQKEQERQDLAMQQLAPEPQEAPPGTENAQQSTALQQSINTAWMIQLGSFGKKSNATKLRDELRANNFSAYIDKLQGEKGPIWRVKIGPELSMRRAEKVKSAVEKLTGLKGLIVKHG